MLTERQNDILDLLQSGPISVRGIADSTGIPEPSVRRDIQAIRRAGFLVDDARDNNGLYRLHSGNVQSAPVSAGF